MLNNNGQRQQWIRRIVKALKGKFHEKCFLDPKIIENNYN